MADSSTNKGAVVGQNHRVMSMDLSRFELSGYIERTAGCDLVFALFCQVLGPNDVRYLFSFRDHSRRVFGIKVLRGTASWGRNVQKLMNNVLAKKSVRDSLISSDPEVAEMWKRNRA